MKFAIIRTGSKQYLVSKGDEILVESLHKEPKSKVTFETLARGESVDGKIELGEPTLKSEVSAEVVEDLKGDKIRVARFRAKSRYRKVKSFRHKLTKVKITKV